MSCSPCASTSGVTVTANSSDTGNGGSGGDGAYQVNVGLDVYVPSSGWGAGTWGEGTWGTPRDGTSITVSLEATQWSLSLWGEDLIANNRDEYLARTFKSPGYHWNNSIFAGKDMSEGGTWLGLNENGLCEKIICQKGRIEADYKNCNDVIESFLLKK